MTVQEFILCGVALSVVTITALAQAGPRISISEPAWEFGVQRQSIEALSKTIIIKNIGGSELALRQPRLSCGCLRGSIKTLTLAPGESTELSLALDRRNAVKAIASNCIIDSNDPIDPRRLIRIRGEVRPDWWVENRHLVLDQHASSGRVHVREVRVLRDKDTEMRVLEVMSDNPNVTVAWKEIEETESEDRGWLLTIAVQPSAPVGRLLARIVVHADHPMVKQQVVTIIGHKTGPVKVFPSRGVRAGRIHAGSIQEFEVRVTFEESLLDAGVERVDVDGNDTEVSVVKSEAPGAWRIVVAVKPKEEDLGQQRRTLSIYTSAEAQKIIRIPVTWIAIERPSVSHESVPSSRRGEQAALRSWARPWRK